MLLASETGSSLHPGALELSAPLLNGIGVVGFCVLALILFIKGKFYTAAEVRRMEAAHLRELEHVEHDRDEWRTEARIKDQQIDLKDEQIAEKDKQLGHMAEAGRLLDSVMRAIQGRGESHEVSP